MTTCETCQGNGEIVTDWEEYLNPTSDLSGEAGTADCPDCDGGAMQAHIDAQDAKIKALVEALEAIEGRIEQAANDFNDATRWPDVAHFMSDCTVMEWVMAPARAVIDKTEETT